MKYYVVELQDHNTALEAEDYLIEDGALSFYVPIKESTLSKRYLSYAKGYWKSVCEVDQDTYDALFEDSVQEVH